MDKTRPSKTHPLAAVGVDRDADALLILPKTYLDMRAPITSLAGAIHGDDATRLYEAKVIFKQGFNAQGASSYSPSPAKLKLEFELSDLTVVSAAIFGMTFAWSDVKVGDLIQFTAKLDFGYFGFCFKSASQAQATGRVHPVYVGVPGQIAGALIGPVVQAVLTNKESLLEISHAIRGNKAVVDVLRERGYRSGTQFLKHLHSPQTPNSGIAALNAARLACVRDIQNQGRRNEASQYATSLDITDELIRLVAAQPETLSTGQKKALNTIRKAFLRPGVLKVLLNGDVGSGKTLVFLLACAAVANLGRRVAIMLPNELIARQVAHQAVSRFQVLEPLLVLGSEKYELSASNRLVIGTTALLSLDLDLGLLVIDEQHKFSVEQRQQLVGTTTHVIEASATPIPRSLALALFDGWTEARITGVPFDKTISSHILTPDVEFHAKQAIRVALSLGKKTIMVYPSVGSGEKSVVAAHARLDEAFPGQVAMAHGKLTSAQKDEAIESFRSGPCHILVASTVIEVGVDIPNVTVFVVHEAQTFGVSQLHQMRGRLVRNGGEGDFFMMVKADVAKKTLSRLEAVRDNLDGFALAERDLELRGFGDVLGDCQSGATGTFFKLPRLEAKDFLGTAIAV